MSLLRTGILSLLLSLTVTACGPRTDGDPADERSLNETPPATMPPRTESEDWTVSMEGSGPFRIGMVLAELAPHLAADVDTTSLRRECDYVRGAAAPDSMLFMIENGRLVRVDVTGGSAATLEGARVGDTESRILSLYPSAVRGPHKYTDGAYLTVTGADSVSKYVFETDGQSVTRYRAGVAPAVDYVEGCS